MVPPGTVQFHPEELTPRTHECLNLDASNCLPRGDHSAAPVVSLVQYATESGVRGKFIANEKIGVSSDRATDMHAGPFATQHGLSFFG
jgi:hypothetical protein